MQPPIQERRDFDRQETGRRHRYRPARHSICYMPTFSQTATHCVHQPPERSRAIDFQLIREWFGEERPHWKVVTLARSLESPLSYLPEMVRQVFHMATSRAVVLDSYCITASLLGSRIKAPVIQIWHALGNMKKFGYTALDTEEGHSSSTAKLMRMHEATMPSRCPPSRTRRIWLQDSTSKRASSSNHRFHEPTCSPTPIIEKRSDRLSPRHIRKQLGEKLLSTARHSVKSALPMNTKL